MTMYKELNRFELEFLLQDAVDAQLRLEHILNTTNDVNLFNEQDYWGRRERILDIQARIKALDTLNPYSNPMDTSLMDIDPIGFITK